VIAGNVTLMSSAKLVYEDLSAQAAAEPNRQSKQRFAAVPLVAPINEGLVLGVTGVF
jgi:hypothetical protein